MKKTTNGNNGNMYEVALDEAWELFGAHVNGARASLVLVVSAWALGAQARAALESSAKALGYAEGCTFATLHAGDEGAGAVDAIADAPAMASGDARSAHSEAGIDEDASADAALDAQALFLLVEGIDPRCIVAADRYGADALARAYHCPVTCGEANRVLGRTVVAFREFSALLADANAKQRAWALLKKLPKLEER